MSSSEQSAGLDRARLDQILTMQLIVAWAGEADTDPARLGWWRTAMCDEFGGEDLLQRLLPHTWRWAVLESARQAARRVEDRARERIADASRVVSLFRLGFEIDEQLDDHLANLKRADRAPFDALSALKPVIGKWAHPALDTYLNALPKAEHTTSAVGRKLKKRIPGDLVAAAGMLCAALRPFSETYPLPHFRVD